MRGRCILSAALVPVVHEQQYSASREQRRADQKGRIMLPMIAAIPNPTYAAPTICQNNLILPSSLLKTFPFSTPLGVRCQPKSRPLARGRLYSVFRSHFNPLLFFNLYHRIIPGLFDRLTAVCETLKLFLKLLKFGPDLLRPFRIRGLQLILQSFDRPS